MAQVCVPFDYDIDSRHPGSVIAQVTVCQKESYSVVHNQGIVAQNRKLQQHLVYFRIAVASYGDDSVCSFVQFLSDCHRIKSFRQTVPWTVVQEVSAQAEHVALLGVEDMQNFLQSSQRTVYVGYK
jgi:hypothetical protein